MTRIQDTAPAQHASPPGLPEDGPPMDDAYMGLRQQAYFRQKLLDWRQTLLTETQEALVQLKDGSQRDVGDEVDRASREASQTLELRTRERCRKLLAKIDAALARIEDGDYGWCEETGEPIGLARLDARPVATLCVEAQERRELRERQAGRNR